MSRFWDEATTIIDKTADTDFDRCYSKELLDNVATLVCNATSVIGCSVATAADAGPVQRQLLRFWNDMVKGILPPQEWLRVLNNEA